MSTNSPSLLRITTIMDVAISKWGIVLFLNMFLIEVTFVYDICLMCTMLCYYFYIPYSMLTIKNLVSIFYHIVDPSYPSPTLPPTPSFLVTTILFSVMIFYFDCLGQTCFQYLLFFTHPRIYSFRIYLGLTYARQWAEYCFGYFKISKILFLFLRIA